MGKERGFLNLIHHAVFLQREKDLCFYIMHVYTGLNAYIFACSKKRKQCIMMCAACEIKTAEAHGAKSLGV